MNKSKDELRIYLEESRVRITDVFEIPQIIVEVDDNTIATLSNFSASVGKAKAKKTFNATSIAASALSGKQVLKYRAKMPKQKAKILYIDTEQSKNHCLKVVKRIYKLADLDEQKDCSNLLFFALRKYSPRNRINIIQKAIEETENLGLVIIDGIRDLAYDINSPSEATNLITNLMQWTDNYGIHIHVVLHTNKSDDNTRGHLGTEVNNKAETVILITKDATNQNISIVSPMFTRDMEFTPFPFMINDEGIPELVHGYTSPQKGRRKAATPDEISMDTHIEALETIFKDKEVIKRIDLLALLQSTYEDLGYKMGNNKIEDLRKYLVEEDLLVVQSGTYFRK